MILLQEYLYKHRNKNTTAYICTHKMIKMHTRLMLQAAVIILTLKKEIVKMSQRCYSEFKRLTNFFRHVPLNARALVLQTLKVGKYHMIQPVSILTHEMDGKPTNQQVR